MMRGKPLGAQAIGEMTPVHPSGPSGSGALVSGGIMLGSPLGLAMVGEIMPPDTPVTFFPPTIQSIIILP